MLDGIYEKGVDLRERQQMLMLPVAVVLKPTS